MPQTVLVIGAGPGGSVTAGFLAKSGQRVIVMEQAALPRAHVGESLVTSFPYVLSLLGEKYLNMVKAGKRFNGESFEVQEKLGAFLTLADQEMIYTELGWADKGDRSIQTRRDHLDEFLADVARDLGADIRTETTVKDIDMANKTVSWTNARGESGELAFDYIVDCSGYRKLLHRHVFGEDDGTRYFKSMDNVAMTSWWKNTALMKDPIRRKSVLIDLIRDPDTGKTLGWAWFIPVDDENLSVGTVVNRELFQSLRAGRPHHDVHLELLHKILRGYNQLVGPHAEEVTSLVCVPDRSHCVPRSCDPEAGWFLAGDSAMFLDPFLSTGVHMACWTGMLTAIAINSLDKGLLTKSQAEEFHRRMAFRQFARLQMIISSVLHRIGHEGCTLEHIRQDVDVNAWDDALELALPNLGYRSVADATDEQFAKLIDTVYSAWRFFCVLDSCKDGGNPAPSSCPARAAAEMARKKMGSTSMVYSIAAGALVGGFTEYFGDLWKLNHIGFYAVDVHTLTASRMYAPTRAILGVVKFGAKSGMPLATAIAGAASAVAPFNQFFFRNTWRFAFLQTALASFSVMATLGTVAAAASFLKMRN